MRRLWHPLVRVGTKSLIEIDATLIIGSHEQLKPFFASFVDLFLGSSPSASVVDSLEAWQHLELHDHDKVDQDHRRCETYDDISDPFPNHEVWDELVQEDETVNDQDESAFIGELENLLEEILVKVRVAHVRHVDQRHEHHELQLDAWLIKDEEGKQDEKEPPDHEDEGVALDPWIARRLETCVECAEFRFSFRLTQFLLIGDQSR